MKRFLIRVSEFALAVLLLLGAAEWYVRSLPNPSRDKHQMMLRHSSKVRILVLGSSQTFYGIDPSELGRDAYSLAQVSQTYRYDNELLHHYPFPRLRYVILPFSFFSLYEDFELQIDYTYVPRYRLYMDCGVHSYFSRAGLELLQKQAFLEKLKSLWQVPQLEWNAQTGFGIYRKSRRAQVWDDGKEKIRKDTYEVPGLAAVNETFLMRIFSYCVQHHVKVILITPPVSPVYYRAQNRSQRAYNHRVLVRMLKQWKNVNYYNFEQDSRFTSDDFFDATHLNTQGAQKLTRLVGEQVGE